MPRDTSRSARDVASSARESSKALDELKRKGEAMKTSLKGAVKSTSDSFGKFTDKITRTSKAIVGLTGTIAGFVTAIVTVNKGLKDLGEQFKHIGKDGAANLEKLETQFVGLLGSVQLAKQRIKELADFAANTPFFQEQVIEANRMLEVFTRGALSSLDAMKLVGDAAANSGKEIEEVAFWIGRLHQAMAANQPIGEAALRLTELGVITPGVRQAVETMSETGATFAERWRVVTTELEASTGAMKRLSETSIGLQSTWEDTKTLLEAEFGKGFMEGHKRGLKGTKELMDALRGPAKNMGEFFGSFANQTAKFNESLATFAARLAKIPGLMVTLATAASVVAVAVKAAFSVMLVVLVVNVLALVGAMGGAAAAMGVFAATAGFVGNLLKSLITLNFASAKAFLDLAIAELKAAGAANIFSFSAANLRLTLQALWGVVWSGTKLLGTLAKAMFLNPAVLGMTALVGAIAAYTHLGNSIRRTNQELIDARKSTDAMSASLERQARAIKTVEDLLQAQAKAAENVARAEAEYREVLNRGQPLVGFGQNARLLREKGRAVDEAKRQQGTMMNFDRRNLARTPAQSERALRLAEQAEQNRLNDQERSIRNAGSPGERIDALRRREADRLERYNQAEAEMRRQHETQFRKQSAGSVAEAARIGLTSDSEIEKLKTKVDLFDQLNAAKDRVDQIMAKIAEVPKGTSIAGTGLLGELEAAEAAVKEIEKASQGVPMTAAAQSVARDELKQRQEQLKNDHDLVAVKSAQADTDEAVQALANRNVRARLEAEREIAGLNDNAFQARLEELRIDRERLETAESRAELTDVEVKKQKEILDAQEAEFRREASRRREDFKNQISGGIFSLQANVARASGRGRFAKQLEEQARQQEDAIAERRRFRELLNSGIDEGRAGRIAAAERKGNQAGRQLQELLGQRSHIVANSLSRIGLDVRGVAGSDPVVGNLEKIKQLLEQEKEAIDVLVEETQQMNGN